LPAREASKEANESLMATHQGCAERIEVYMRRCRGARGRSGCGVYELKAQT
jgi:hypothetical protein